MLAKTVAVDIASVTGLVEIAAVLVSGVRLVVIVHRVEVVPTPVVFCAAALVLAEEALDIA